MTRARAAADGDGSLDPFGLLRGDAARYVGVPSMADTVKGALASAAARPAEGASLRTLFGCKATRVAHALDETRGARWTVRSSDGEERAFDAVGRGGPPLLAAAAAEQPLPTGDGSDDAVALRALRGQLPGGRGAAVRAARRATRRSARARRSTRPPSPARATCGGSRATAPRRARARDDGLELWVALSTEGFAERVARELAGGERAGAASSRPPRRRRKRCRSCVAAELLAAVSAALHAELPRPVYAHAQRCRPASRARRSAFAAVAVRRVGARRATVACGDWAAAAPRVSEAGAQRARRRGRGRRARATPRAARARSSPRRGRPARTSRVAATWPDALRARRRPNRRPGSPA